MHRKDTSMPMLDIALLVRFTALAPIERCESCQPVRIGTDDGRPRLQCRRCYRPILGVWNT